MPFVLLTTTRTTVPDPVTLAAAATALDPTAVLARDAGYWVAKKGTAWTQPQINAAQNLLDTTPAATPQLLAQRLIDAMPIYDKARDLALIDQLNIIRNLLVPAKTPDITPAAAIAAIRNKAGTL